MIPHDDYAQFLARKRLIVPPSGFDAALDDTSPAGFDYQRAIVAYGARKGKWAAFLDTGLGKTLISLDWSRLVSLHAGRPVLCFAPLGVAPQTVAEGERFGISVTICRSQADVAPGINITNYEKLHLFDPAAFAGVVLDEGSILKSHDGATRNRLLEAFARTPYKLVATATPSPNDFMELGTYAEFLGVMTRTEMLATFFTHDGGDTSEWRLKGHAERDFYRWLASWAVAMRSPADLGYDGSRHVLPPKHRHLIEVQAGDETAMRQGALFAMEAQTLSERRDARRASLPERVARAVAQVAAEPHEKWLVWCDLNAEQDALESALRAAGLSVASIRGTTPDDERLALEASWRLGDAAVLLTKPAMFGHGMNWQHCARQVFVGLSDSFEQKYQAERRSHRYGQTRPVHIYDVISELEGAVARNQERKEAQHHALMDGLVSHMRAALRAELGATSRMSDDYRAITPMRLPAWLKEAA